MKAQEREPELTLTLTPMPQLAAKYIDDAPLYFANGATDVDPKRGLSVHGPADKSSSGPQSIRVGIVSSADGIQEVTQWMQTFNDRSIESSGTRPFIEQTFPGFLQAFNCKLISSDNLNEPLLTREVEDLLNVVNPNLRIRKAAELYASKVRVVCRRMSRPNVIICHEPKPIEEKVGAGMKGAQKRQGALSKDEKEEAQKIRKTYESHIPLFPLDEDTQNMIDMAVNQDFRALLKAKCLEFVPPIQILTQTILEKMTKPKPINAKRSTTRIGQDAPTIAWNLGAAIYYKANHFPWHVGYLNQGTCYIGISFYHDRTTAEKEMHASLGQIFMDTGQGMVVRGKSFKWDTETKRAQPRLTEDAAFNLLQDGLTVYKQHHNNQAPNRVVIHKSSRYSPAERNGFVKACAEVPKYDLVAFSDGRDIFFYRNGDNPVLRGTCVSLGSSSYLIYTKGFVPYQHGFHKPRVPRPLEVIEHYGDTPLDEIAKEVIALTRLDWNTTDYCIYWPVTLKFSDKVGDILGRVPEGAEIREEYYYYM